MKTGLSPRQRELWEILKETMEKDGASPTYDNLAKKLNVKSLASVASLLKALVRKGFIQIMPGVHHGIRLLKTDENSNLIKRPLLGMSAAGAPILADEYIEDYIDFSVNAVTEIPDFFLRVRGDSMINIGIDNGDLVAVKKISQPDNGDVVVFLLNNESTIKRFYKENGTIILKAENEKYPNIVIKDTGDYSAVQGKIVGVFKK
jgi:repressor LexA